VFQGFLDLSDRAVGYSSDVADIFISYTHQDRETAERLASALTAWGWEVWWDRTLPPGTCFRAEIARQLQTAKCVVALWSRESVKSDWVVDEAEEAKVRGILVQAIIENVQPPHGFRQIHSGNLIGWTGQLDAPEALQLREGISRFVVSANTAAPQFVSFARVLRDAASQQSALKDPEPKSTAVAYRPRKTGSEVPEDFYLDPKTRLMWAKEDNREDISWPEANDYAQQLRLGGCSDWRLPTINELEKLYDPEGGSKQKHIQTPFRLTSEWVWSSTKESSELAWYFNFLFGRRDLCPTKSRFPMRALCVRRSGG
jgi:hypothetical protein